MHQEPIQQKESATPDHALQLSGFDGGESTSASPPAFQLKASNGPLQRSTADGISEVVNNAASAGLDTSKVDIEVSNAPKDVGAVATHQPTGDGGSKIAVTPDSPTQMKNNVGHELGHAMSLQSGYTPTADTNIGGAAIDTNQAEESKADSFMSKVV